MERRPKNKPMALLFFAIWAVVVVATSYRLLDSGISLVIIPVMGLISFIIMMVGTTMFLSSFQNINAAMVREFHEVEVPSLTRFMGLTIWVSSLLFYCSFALISPAYGVTIGAIVSVVLLVAVVVGVTVYSSRSDRFKK